jgi:hypothetical protein
MLLASLDASILRGRNILVASPAYSNMIRLRQSTEQTHLKLKMRRPYAYLLLHDYEEPL